MKKNFGGFAPEPHALLKKLDQNFNEKAAFAAFFGNFCQTFFKKGGMIHVLFGYASIACGLDYHGQRRE
ncbi:MAG: hypothetical protein FWB88_04155 [Defluviitaleaceae bacterium]|nr:hypothetical protein [Defluviitaleaceae bacterium]MCL2238790.1 hypothetical protein [Defluviitaleaceae bacterium]